MSKIIKSHLNSTERKSKKITIRNLFEEGLFQNHNDMLNSQQDTCKVEEDRETLNRLRLEIQEAEEKAGRIILEAEDQAKVIRETIRMEQEQATLEIEQLKQTAEEQGYKDGYEKGQAEGFSSYSNLIDQAQHIINQSEQEYEKTIESAQPVIVELAAALAQRMVNQKLTEDPDMWADLLTQVMTEVREHENVRIYVHPDWFERTNQQKEELEQLLSHTERLFIYPDAGLMKNGCVIESKYGRIDATVDKQLSELKLQLLEKLKEGDDERRATN
ncbi:flagellar assembly protein FliH [Halalkalibacter alkaliphilus]|uniref:Flagellar assembly protein FliH n=1 Tax=Halalkalibacter alkaliphilus TaxID=2917993 RepID=A0A9X1ZY17_9BACI|nr:flagellar assembly protein FliH [Halalkalibacter alkaliphilus]MCL7746466.1 flagellar assembly protein FliH [Halalkalibacter alkaliphilus]